MTAKDPHLFLRVLECTESHRGSHCSVEGPHPYHAPRLSDLKQNLPSFVRDGLVGVQLTHTQHQVEASYVLAFSLDLFIGKKAQHCKCAFRTGHFRNIKHGKRVFPHWASRQQHHRHSMNARQLSHCPLGGAPHQRENLTVINHLRVRNAPNTCETRFPSVTHIAKEWNLPLERTSKKNVASALC